MTAQLLRAIDQFPSKRILVLGDVMLDSYIVGSSTRLCQEAPVPVVAVRERTDCPGGAANTAVNLASLGCQVELISVVGADHEGDRLHELLRNHGVGTRLLAVQESRRTLSKQRVVNDGLLLARIDEGDTDPVPALLERLLLNALGQAFAGADAVVISDYGYGVLTPGVLGRLRTLQQRFQQLIAVDARDLVKYRPLGVTVVKPNFGEALQLAGLPPDQTDQSRVEAALQIGATVLDRTGARIAAITLDADGAVVVERGQPPHRTCTQAVDQQRTAGAGDTYLATLTAALAAGVTTSGAAELAAHAAAVVVSQASTVSCTARELRQTVSARSDIWDGREQPPATRDEPGDCRCSEEQDEHDCRIGVDDRRAPALRQA